MRKPVRGLSKTSPLFRPAGSVAIVLLKNAGGKLLALVNAGGTASQLTSRRPEIFPGVVLSESPSIFRNWLMVPTMVALSPAAARTPAPAPEGVSGLVLV